MKLILTGGTGYIGGCALQRALAVAEVTEVVAISRRELPIKHPKLTTLIKTDFTTYSNDDLAKLKGAEACIWALGKPGGSYEVKKTYPVAARDAFTEHLAPTLPKGKKFRFVLVTGALTIADQERWVPSAFKGLQEVGDLQNQWIAYEQKHADVYESYVARPAAVHEPNGWAVMLLPYNVKIANPVLAAALVEIAVRGDEHSVNDNNDLNRIGKRILGEDN